MSHSNNINYCQYVGEVCDQVLPKRVLNSLFVAYPSEPTAPAEALEGTIALIRREKSLNIPVCSWKELPVEGNVVFCEICKAIREASCTLANITSANFNVLFEYGFAIGVGSAIWPLVEEGISKRARAYLNIEMLATIGYSSFENSKTLYRKLLKKRPWARTSQFQLSQVLGAEVHEASMGLLYIKSTHNDEPSLRISERLSLLPMEVITDDAKEIPYRPLPWYFKQIANAHIVIINLGSKRMENAWNYRAKCALVAGLSLALGRRLLITGEDIEFKPIDYRDLIQNYKNATQAERIVVDFLAPHLSSIQSSRNYHQFDIKKHSKSNENILDGVDLGDYIAENEIQLLEDYFVETPEYLSALLPASKVFVGRKGTGKTANYFMVLNKLLQDSRNVVCKIKPKEYELNELLELVKNELSRAKQGYLLESMWKFMLYSEAIKAIHEKILEKSLVSEAMSISEESIMKYVETRPEIFKYSFTGRLVLAIRDLNKTGVESSANSISEILHTDEIGIMHEILCGYIADAVHHFAIIIDGLDANWYLGDDYEIMSDLLLALIGCCRDMWRSCNGDIVGLKGDTMFSTLIFLRSDVFRIMLERAREPDKLQYELISWADIDSLIRVIELRLLASMDIEEGQSLNWSDILEPGFKPDEMKDILANSIIFRPRDIIFYFQSATHYARLRGTKYLTKRDFNSAIREYSEYAFRSLLAESQPCIPDMTDLLLAFAEHKTITDIDEIYKIFEGCEIKKKDYRKVLNFLLESNFIGYGIDEYNYKFPVTPAEAAIMIRRALRHKSRNDKPSKFKIHKAFHEALSLSST